jgi:hypothetical protein
MKHLPHLPAASVKLSGGLALVALIIDLAAARDSTDPVGKSPGRGLRSVSSKDQPLFIFSITYGLLTANGCIGHGLDKPIGQISFLGVLF